MHKPRKPRCPATGKMPYGSRGLAALAVATFLADPTIRRKPGPVEPYRCRHCKRWHFGHPSRKEVAP